MDTKYHEHNQRPERCWSTLERKRELKEIIECVKCDLLDDDEVDMGMGMEQSSNFVYLKF